MNTIWWVLIVATLCGLLTVATVSIVMMRRRIRTQEELLCTDELTSAGNRRGLQRYLKAIEAIAGTEWSCFVMVIDGDNFKAINDQYGHHAGDAVLRSVVQRARTVGRQNGGYALHDYIARIGGDEFVLVLASSNQQVADACVTELSSLLRKQVCRVGAETIPFSFSVGVSQYKLGQAFDAVLKLADDAMYARKPKPALRAV